jgi:hypothetical protein
LTELEESKPLLINARDKEVFTRLKKPATTDRSMDPIRIARPDNRQEMRQEKEHRKAQRELGQSLPAEFDYKESGILLPNKIN